MCEGRGGREGGGGEGWRTFMCMQLINEYT